MNIRALRQTYHRSICEQLLDLPDEPARLTASDLIKQVITHGMVDISTYPFADKIFLEGETFATEFTQMNQNFLADMLPSIRSEKWSFLHDLSDFPDYEYLTYVKNLPLRSPNLFNRAEYEAWLMPDIIICNEYIEDMITNEVRAASNPSIEHKHYISQCMSNHSFYTKTLYAIISCKWILGNKRSLSPRFEAISLLRNRKSCLPYTLVITADPRPSRIAALALGTGDLDCVYHFALNELVDTSQELKNQDSLELLNMMIDGRRLRDISDLPFDLAL